MSNIATSSERSVSHLAVAWILMLPLLYFASTGSFWFQSVVGNNTLFQDYGSLTLVVATSENTVVLLAILLVSVALLFPRLMRVLSRCGKDKVFIASAVLAVVSCLWSQFPTRSLGYSLCLVVDTLFAFYLYERFGTKRLLQLLLVLGWICVLLSVALSLFCPQFGVSQIAESAGRWRGMYGNPNACSIMTSLLLVGAFFTPATTLVAKCFRIIYGSLSAFLILMTQSATGKILLGSLVVCVGGAKLAEKLSLRNRVIGAVLIVVTLPLGLSSVVFRLSQISYMLGRDPSFSGRTEIWNAAIISLLKHPFLGYGYMAFWRGLQGESATAALGATWVAATTHNGFLDVWLTLGMVGLGLILCSFVRALRDAVLCLGAGGTPFTRWCICIIALMIILSVDEVPAVDAQQFRMDAFHRSLYWFIGRGSPHPGGAAACIGFGWNGVAFAPVLSRTTRVGCFSARGSRSSARASISFCWRGYLDPCSTVSTPAPWRWSLY